MKVRFLTSIAGLRFAYRPNQVVDLKIEKKEINKWIEAGICEVVAVSKKQETATATPDCERAVVKRKTRKVKKK
jgi:hypothetical protein